MPYQPEPIKTGDITLDQSLIELEELLARNIHNHWASARLAEGWTLGPNRNDHLKTHPGLVPYEALSEIEKNYDRRTATEALKAILKLGYKIDVNGVPLLDGPETEESQRKELLSSIKTNPVRLSGLYKIWSERRKSLWITDPPFLYRAMGEQACKIGEPFFACDVVNEGLEFFPRDGKLLQVHAWALAQSGAIDRAEKLLLSLPKTEQDDVDAIGLLGRCYKDFGRMAPEAAERQAFFRKSAETYQRGFILTQSSYLGLNAATVFYLIDEKAKARELAREALARCRKEMEFDSENVWSYATLAELALILDDPEVERLYKTFRTLAGNDFGVVFSARKQARLILAKQGLPEDSLDSCLHVPRVVVFAGHMFDSPTRNPARFTSAMEPLVVKKIDEALEKFDVGIAFSSAACGSDILFLEALLKREMEYHLVLPLLPEIFRKISVVEIGGYTWGDRFDKVLTGAASVTISNGQDCSINPISLQYANQLLFGMARIRARTIGSSLQGLAVWNEKPGDGPGGVASAVEMWKAWNEDVLVLNPFPPTGEMTSNAAAMMTPAIQTVIRAILFADIVGYSKLTEENVPRYAKYFLGELGALINRSPHRPMTRNTWGDALYFVFDNVQKAGLLALEIQNFVCEPGKWTRLGFSKDLNLRIALHAGPVYPLLDGIMDHETYCGTHVNRAARIEPITQEGQIFASEHFAALVEAEGISDFRCDYVGEKELPKKFGKIRAHVLRAI